MDKIFEELEAVDPRDKDEVKKFFSDAGINVSDDFAEFYGRYNGTEGEICDGRAYVQIFGIDEIMQLNNDYKVREMTETAFIFGSDGADEALAFDFSVGEYVVTPFVGMFLLGCDCRSKTAEDFFNEFSEMFDDDDYDDESDEF